MPSTFFKIFNRRFEFEENISEWNVIINIFFKKTSSIQDINQTTRSSGSDSTTRQDDAVSNIYYGSNNRYKQVKSLGAGQFGQVFLIVDTQLKLKNDQDA